MQTKGIRERKIYEFLKREDQDQDEDVENDEIIIGKVGSLEHLKGVEQFLSKLRNKEDIDKVEDINNEL